MDLRIVTWNTNKKGSQRLSDEHWAELRGLTPSLIVLTECPNYGRIPAWVTHSVTSNRGVAIAVSVGTLQPLDIVALSGLKTRVCEWRLSQQTRVLVAGFHVHENYGRVAEKCICGLEEMAKQMPTIVAGDFNINSDYISSHFVRFNRARNDIGLRSCWHDVHKRAFGGEPPTWRNYHSDGRPSCRGQDGRQDRNFMVDYLLVGPQFSLIDSQLAEMEDAALIQQKRWANSDHRAVWADVRLANL